MIQTLTFQPSGGLIGAEGSQQNEPRDLPRETQRPRAEVTIITPARDRSRRFLSEWFQSRPIIPKQRECMSASCAQDEGARRPAPLRVPGNCSELLLSRSRGDYGCVCATCATRTDAPVVFRRYADHRVGSRRDESPGAVSGCAVQRHAPHRACRRVPSSCVARRFPLVFERAGATPPPTT